MTWFPISNHPIQYVDGNGDPYGDAVVKFYEDGTTTPLTISADVSGTTTAAYATLDSSGYLNISGNKAIVHVEEPYKMALYPDQCSADSDIGAVWTLDVIDPGSASTLTSLTVTTNLDVNGHISIGSGANPGTSGDNVLVIETGTAPTTSTADTIQLYSTDLSAGNTMVGLFTEGTPLSGGTTAVGTMAIKLNGTTQYLLTSQVAGASQVFDGVTNIDATETVYTVSDAAGVMLDPANGFYQVWELGSARTPTDNFSNGQRMRLMIDDGTAYGVTWTTIGVTWVNNGGVAPTLATSGYTVVDLWQVGGVVYGALVGDGS